jgi:hypothetical protein
VSLLNEMHAAPVMEFHEPDITAASLDLPPTRPA